MIYSAHCYVDNIDHLQRIIDAAEADRPELKAIKPRFRYDRNNIGPDLMAGTPLHDPIIYIEWDVPGAQSEAA